MYNALNNNQKTEVAEKLYSMCDPTDLIKFENVEKIPMTFYVNATLLNPSYTTAEVESYIKTVLENTYGIQNMDFGVSVYNSDYVRLIDEVKGIDNHISEIKLHKDGITLQGEYYGNFSLPIYPVDYSTLLIYVKDTTVENPQFELFATCDENGNFIGVDSYITNDASIDLTSGVGTIRCTGGLTGNYKDYEFRIVYQYIEQDLKNPKRNNLLYYEDAVIVLNYN